MAQNNIEEQVEKAIVEIKKRYYKGAKFNLHMLTTSLLNDFGFDYDYYINLLQRRVESDNIAKFYKIDKGERIYIKL